MDVHRGRTRPVPSPDPRSTISVESFNANRGIRTLKDRVTATKASVLVAQEIGVADADYDDFVAWLGRRGWKCLASPSLASKGTTPVQGVAVMARDHVGLRGPDLGPAVLHRRRALHAVVQFPGWPQLHILAFYLVVGAGIKGKNARILADIGTRVSDIAYPVVLAGDWNATPRQVEESGFPREAHTVLVAPTLPTCITPTSSRTIDFFATNDAAKRLVDSVSVDLAWPKRPHRPVTIDLAADGLRQQYMVYSVAAQMGTQRVFGPMREAPTWSVANHQAEAAAQACATDGARVAWCLLSKAWATFAATAEEAVRAMTGKESAKNSTWGSPPKPRWVDYHFRPEQLTDVQAVARGWAWLDQALSNLHKLLGDVNTPLAYLEAETDGFASAQYFASVGYLHT